VPRAGVVAGRRTTTGQPAHRGRWLWRWPDFQIALGGRSPAWPVVLGARLSRGGRSPAGTPRPAAHRPPAPSTADGQTRTARPQSDAMSGTAPPPRQSAGPRRRRGPARSPARRPHNAARSCGPPPPAPPPVTGQPRPQHLSRISITCTSRYAAPPLQITRSEPISSGSRRPQRRGTRRWSHDCQPGCSHKCGKNGSDRSHAVTGDNNPPASHGLTNPDADYEPASVRSCR
jgi:hypothetical protein